MVELLSDAKQFALRDVAQIGQMQTVPRRVPELHTAAAGFASPINRGSVAASAVSHSALPAERGQFIRCGREKNRDRSIE